MRFLASLCCALGLMGALALALGQRPSATENLAARVAEALPRSGVDHPVTAVLLNFRGYDTLMEIAVLLLALAACLALQHEQDATPRRAMADPLLKALADWLTPVMILVAGYLLWAGKQQPGGAFQAGAVLAACGVLLRLAGGLPVPPLAGPGSISQRVLPLLGCVAFLGVATGTMGAGYRFLGYPQAWAGALILLIEAALTLSIGVILLGLFDATPAAMVRIKAGPRPNRRLSSSRKRPLSGSKEGDYKSGA